MFCGECEKTYDDDDESCIPDWKINKGCSEQCFQYKKDSCTACNYYYDSSYCSRDSFYDSNKVCFGDNIIYFWKGNEYTFENIKAFQTKNYTYANDAKLKEEKCPENTKNCGILDDNENKLCLPLDSDCPINFISETKMDPNFNYSSTVINGKIFYYTYNNTINKKIIAGLYADSDLYLKNEEDFIILDTNTISGLINDNYVLYREVDLDNAPNIYQNGKSYLKIRYNAKNPDLTKIRKNHQQYVINNLMSEFKNFIIMGMIAYIILSILFILFIWVYIKEKTEIYPDSTIYICHLCISLIFSIMLLIFFALSLICLVKACINISKFNLAKKIDKENCGTIATINLIFIILGFILYVLIIPFILGKVLYIIKKYRGIHNEIQKQVSEITKNDLVNDISNNKLGLNTNTIPNNYPNDNFQQN